MFVGVREIFETILRFIFNSVWWVFYYPPRFVWGNAESQYRLPVSARVPGREQSWFVRVGLPVYQLSLLQDLANQIYWWEDFSKACRQNKIKKGTKLNPEVAEFLCGISVEMGAVPKNGLQQVPLSKDCSLITSAFNKHRVWNEFHLLPRTSTWLDLAQAGCSFQSADRKSVV